MDEATWLACADPKAMERFLDGKASERKMRGLCKRERPASRTRWPLRGACSLSGSAPALAAEQPDLIQGLGVLRQDTKRENVWILTRPPIAQLLPQGGKQGTPRQDALRDGKNRAGFVIPENSRRDADGGHSDYLLAADGKPD